MPIPLGITLPIRLGSNGYFEHTTDAMTQIKANLTNLLLTQKGERVMQPDFGSELHLFIFEPMTDNGMANLRASIESCIAEWMPFVQIIDVQREFDNDNNLMTLVIGFSTIIDPTKADTLTLVF
jgi:phage baseplate assembly protein W